MGDILYCPPAFAPAEGAVVRPAGGTARPTPPDDQLSRVGAAYPHWQAITFRLGVLRGDGAPNFPSFLVRQSGSWPRWSVQVAVDPGTGRVTVREDPGHESFLRARRMSAKALRTGEAGGPAVQAHLRLGTLGLLGLIGTGFSPVDRRFARKRASRIAQA